MGNWFYTSRIDKRVECIQNTAKGVMDENLKSIRDDVKGIAGKFANESKTWNSTARKMIESTEKLVTYSVRSAKEEIEKLSNLSQFIFVLFILVVVSLFNYYQNGFYSLEILIEALFNPSIVGFVIILLSIVFNNPLKVDVFRLFLFSIILFRALYFTKTLKQEFTQDLITNCFTYTMKFIQSLIFDYCIIEFIFIVYSAFFANSRKKQEKYNHWHEYHYREAIFNNQNLLSTVSDNLLLYFFIYCISFKYSFKCFDFYLTLVQSMVIIVSIELEKYIFFIDVFHVLILTNYFSLLIYVWNWILINLSLPQMEEQTRNLLVFFSFLIVYIPANKLIGMISEKLTDRSCIPIEWAILAFINLVLIPFSLLTRLFWFYNEMKYYEITVGLAGLVFSLFLLLIMIHNQRNKAVYQGLLKDSLILDDKERFNLVMMTNSKGCELVYRATRDGFTSEALHSKCDDKQNLVSIIRSNFNHVFGGYTSVAWNENSKWITDPKAFIFSLRRNGATKSDKFMVKNDGYCAFYGNTSHHHLWYGSDINIYSLSNQFVGSYSNFGDEYDLPEGIEYKTDDSKNFLAGNYNQWLTTEIEVYQIII